MKANILLKLVESQIRGWDELLMNKVARDH